MKYFFLTFLLFGIISVTSAQIAVNQTGSTADESAMLDIQSTTKGMLVPRMTTGQRNSISSPANGLLVYDTDTKSFWFRKSSIWREIIDSSNNTVLADSDNDTKVDVESTLDNDEVHFTLGGTEYFVFNGAHIDVNNSGGSVFLGGNAGLHDNYSTSRNVAIGQLALSDNIAGAFNVAMGYSALRYMSGKSCNVAIGNYSMERFNSDGSFVSTYNTAIGAYTLQGNSTPH